MYHDAIVTPLFLFTVNSIVWLESNNAT